MDVRGPSDGPRTAPIVAHESARPAPGIGSLSTTAEVELGGNGHTFARLVGVRRSGKQGDCHPAYEGVQKAFDLVARRLDQRRPPWPYKATEASEERLHALIGAHWPCDERHGFD